VRDEMEKTWIYCSRRRAKICSFRMEGEVVFCLEGLHVVFGIAFIREQVGKGCK
jgi:hypothetical protein